MGRTFDPIEIYELFENFRDKPLGEVIQLMLDKLRAYRDVQFGYYLNLERTNSRWANGARGLLAVLGSLAALLAFFASLSTILKPTWANLEYWALIAGIVSLLLYAVIGSVSFYERATGRTASYFRHLALVTRIRDLWTQLEFALLKIVLETKIADATALDSARERVRGLAEAFCSDLGKLTTEELADWKTAFTTSLSEIEEAAKKGRTESEASLKGAAEEARKSAEKAEAAATAAQEALKPAIINLSVKGEFDGDMTILLDGHEVARTHLRNYPIDGLRPGLRKLEIRAKKGDQNVGDARMIDLKPNLQDILVQLS